jgi:hypothetical protein
MTDTHKVTVPTRGIYEIAIGQSETRDLLITYQDGIPVLIETYKDGIRSLLVADSRGL